MKTRMKMTQAMLMILLATQITVAQNYKAPMIDASGKITDKHGKQIGSLSAEGVIMDEMGMKVAYVDAEGTLVDAKTGKKMGKTLKNGNFVPEFAKTPDEGWSVSTPMNGTCLVKDKDGNIVAEMHENYKQFGACAIHCLTHHMNHGEVLDETKMESTVYACPMHPDVTSDKIGKCSKCGMELKKKN